MRAPSSDPVSLPAGLCRGGRRPRRATAMAWMINNPATLIYLAPRCDAVPQKNGFNSGSPSGSSVTDSRVTSS
ncbi:MAG: hypothetical protein C1943_17200 [Halochromatium sp.]|nr:hypothetical protein [Halochromatium sp.]